MQAGLRGGDGTRVELSFEDASDRTLVKVASTGMRERPPVKVGSLPTMFVRVDGGGEEDSGGTQGGVHRLQCLDDPVDAPSPRAVDRFRGSDGIILDLRGNPGGLAAMMMGISGHFVGEVKPLGTMKTRDNDLNFVANPRTVDTSGKAGLGLRRPGSDSRRRHERQRVGVLFRRHAVDRPRPRIRPDDDGSGAARTVRPAAERRRDDPRVRRFCHGRRARGSRAEA